MPYVVRKKGSQWCVYKEGATSSLGCHDSKSKAQRQQRALYAEEEGESSAISSNVGAMDMNGTDTTLDEERGDQFEGVLAIVGHPTSDGRYLIPGEISQRELPLPFLVQTQTADGHSGAEVAGRIEAVTYIPIEDFDRAEDFHLSDLTEGALVVWAEGTLDGSEFAGEAVRMIENGAGVSVDLPPDRVAPFDPDTLEEVDGEEITFEDLIFGNYLTGIGGKIAAATIVTIPAFEEASVAMVNNTALVASAYGMRMRKATMTAAAAGLAPLDPPSAWFETEEPDEPMPLTITDEGQVYGHLALWDQCHVQFASCERPPRSATNYSYFHVGQIKTEEGEFVNVGRITVGEAGRTKGGHASIVLGRQGAMEHYDKTGCVAAFVRAKDGRHGIWLSGAIRSDAPSERIRDLRACPPSGDWRDYELVAVLSVPVPGFPIPRAEARLVASAAGEEEVATLISTDYTTRLPEGEGMSWTFPCDDLDDEVYRQRVKELTQRRVKVMLTPAERMAVLAARRDEALKVVA